VPFLYLFCDLVNREPVEPLMALFGAVPVALIELLKKSTISTGPSSRNTASIPSVRICSSVRASRFMTEPPPATEAGLQSEPSAALLLVNQALAADHLLSKDVRLTARGARKMKCTERTKATLCQFLTSCQLLLFDLNDFNRTAS
jgi:hypothetical protein